MPNAQTHKVFVYGSLLSGLGNHRWLDGAIFVRAARTRYTFPMVDLGGFPGVLDPGDEGVGSQVVGEVYEVDDDGLRRLDRLESFYGDDVASNFYDRVEVLLDDETTALMYVLNTRGTRASHYFERDFVRCSDWRAHLAARGRCSTCGTTYYKAGASARWCPQTYSALEMQETFRQLAQELGVGVLFGEFDHWPQTVVGTPPTDMAALCRGHAGRLVVASEPFKGAAHVEAALHELAHAQTTDERRMYELAAVWALRFPVAVSTAVAEAAGEALA